MPEIMVAPLSRFVFGYGVPISLAQWKRIGGSVVRETYLEAAGVERAILEPELESQISETRISLISPEIRLLTVGGLEINSDESIRYYNQRLFGLRCISDSPSQYTDLFPPIMMGGRQYASVAAILYRSRISIDQLCVGTDEKSMRDSIGFWSGILER